MSGVAEATGDWTFAETGETDQGGVHATAQAQSSGEGTPHTTRSETGTSYRGVGGMRCVWCRLRSRLHGRPDRPLDVASGVAQWEPCATHMLTGTAHAGGAKKPSDFDAMSIHELKIYLASHNVDASTAIEKGDLIELAKGTVK